MTHGFHAGGRDFEAYQAVYLLHRKFFERRFDGFKFAKESEAIIRKYKDLDYIPGMIAAIRDACRKRGTNSEGWTRLSDGKKFEELPKRS